MTTVRAAVSACPRRPLTACAAALLAPALLLVLPALPGTGSVAHAAALVSNISTPMTGTGHTTLDQAQAFTTGANTAGYSLTSVELEMPRFSGIEARAAFSVSINANDNGAPGNELGVLTAPATLVEGINEFTHSGIDLAANTTYFVVIDHTSGGEGGFVNTAEDTETGAAGWSLGDDSLERDRKSTGAWRAIRRAKKIRISGITGAAPSFGAEVITSQTYTQNTQITTLDLPAATERSAIPWKETCRRGFHTARQTARSPARRRRPRTRRPIPGRQRTRMATSSP